MPKMNITKKDLDALRIVFDRAKDDWLTYRNSGHGPADMGEPEWSAYVIEQDAAIEHASQFLKCAWFILR